jgi:hypothetical protein
MTYTGGGGGGGFYAGGQGRTAVSVRPNATINITVAGGGGQGPALLQGYCARLAHKPTGEIVADARDELYSPCACGHTRWYRREGDTQVHAQLAAPVMPLQGRALPTE